MKINKPIARLMLLASLSTGVNNFAQAEECKDNRSKLVQTIEEVINSQTTTLYDSLLTDPTKLQLAPLKFIYREPYKETTSVKTDSLEVKEEEDYPLWKQLVVFTVVASIHYAIAKARGRLP